MNPEPFVQKIMLEKYGLRFEKMPESSDKTPDFSLTLNGELVMIAEVKNLTDVIPSKEAGWQVSNSEPGIFEYGKADNGPARVGRIIYSAYEQIKMYDCLRCVTIVSDDLADYQSKLVT